LNQKSFSIYSKEDILKLFARNANSQVAIGQKAYMKNKFEFFGIKTPERRKLQHPILQREALPDKMRAFELIRQLWDEPQREFQYLAMELLYKYRNQFEKPDIDLTQHLLIHKSWWDTVDFLAANIVGSYLRKFPEEREDLVNKWLNSDNIWLQRTCLLFQLKYKDELDTRKLEEIIHRLHGTKEFFINKVIGGIWREYSKPNPGWVVEYVNINPLHSLSKRESLKVMNRK